MKKLLISLLSVLLLAGCGRREKTDPEITPDPRESVSISETDFTQSDAMKVWQAALDEYCGVNACKAVTVRISGKDLSGTYTYADNGLTKTSEGTLYDVTVNPNQKTSWSASRTEFKGKPDPAETEPAETEEPEDKKDGGDSEKEDKEEKEGKKHNFDIDDEVDESDEDARNDTKVYEESGIQIWRLYTKKGTIEFTGKYEGDSKFLIQIMDLKQNVKGEPVKMTKAGDIEGSMKLEEGYYYIVIEAAGGWSLYWNRTYE